MEGAVIGFRERLWTMGQIGIGSIQALIHRQGLPALSWRNKHTTQERYSMSNTAKLLAALLVVLGIFMLEIIVELLMPIAWVVVIAIPLVFGYLIRELYRTGKGRF